MAQDVKISPNEFGLFDLQIEGADFASVDGLETSIAVSLFTDGRASSALVQDPARRRGWIGDVFTAEINRKIGSELWILDQARLTTTTVNQARVFATDCLSWLIEDFIAQSVNVVVVRNDSRSITITVELTTRQGETRTYEYLWRNTDANNISNS